jgi:hypothetical protein
LVGFGLWGIMQSIVIAVLSLALASGPDKLDQARTAYLNKRVVVKSVVFRPAIEANGKYQYENVYNFIASKYIGQTATVIAVQPTEDAPQPAEKVNALGEVVTQPVREPWFDIVVKFDDGSLAILNETAAGLPHSILLPENIAEMQAARKTREEKIKSFVGRTLYATALSTVYRPDVALTEMQNRNRIVPPLLVPLKIEVAKWNEEAGCAVVKLRFPDGGAALTLLNESGESCADSRLLSAFPAYLSRADIAAVKTRMPVRGMSESALYYAIGYPESENDYGRGGKQLIYKSNLIVYLDTSGKVEDVQRMHN